MKSSVYTSARACVFLFCVSSGISSKARNANECALFNQKEKRTNKQLHRSKRRKSAIKVENSKSDNEKLEARSITRRLYTSQTCLSTLNNSNILPKQSEKASGGRTKSLEAEIMDGMKEKKCIVVIVKAENERERVKERNESIRSLSLSLAYPSS